MALAILSMFLPFIVIETTGTASSSSPSERALELAVEREVPLGKHRCPPGSQAPRCQRSGQVPSATATASPTPTGSTPTTTTLPPTTTPTTTTTTPPPRESDSGSTDARWPNALSTGVPVGTNLTTQNGNMTISSAGTIVENKLINGCITVNAANVTIRKSKIVCSGTAAIFNNSTGLLVEDAEISCNGTRGTGLTWQNFTARRINAYACENIIWAEHRVVIEDSYIHDPIDYDPVTDPHTDAIQVPVGATDITIRHNTIYGNYVNQQSFGNAAIMTAPATTNVFITENLLAGGGYTMYCNQDVRFTNNRFSRIFVSTVGGFGPWTNCQDETQVTGNVYHETGQALNP